MDPQTDVNPEPPSEVAPASEEGTETAEPGPEDPGRRRFLTLATVSLSGVIAGGLGIPAFAYLADVANPVGDEAAWVPVGSTNLLEPGSPLLVRYTVRRNVGWVEQENEVALYLVAGADGEVTGLSNICPHLGCRVRWVDERQKFFCPCHNGVFAIDGTVEEGPPPEPLPHLEVKVEGSQVLARERIENA